MQSVELFLLSSALFILSNAPNSELIYMDCGSISFEKNEPQTGRELTTDE